MNDPHAGFTETTAGDGEMGEREERLRLATEHAEIGFWDVDIVNDVLIWPPRVKAMFGISPDVQVSMQDFYEGLHPDDRAATSAAFDLACDPVRRGLYDVEYRTVGKEDGIVRWVAAKGRGVFDGAGLCVRVIGAAFDITPRKTAEAALRDSEERLRALNADLERQVAERTLARGTTWQVTPDLMGVLSGDGYFEQSNPAWALVLGWSESEVARTVFFDFIHPDDLPKTQAAWNDALKQGLPVIHFENRYRTKSGEWRWLQWVAVPEGGKVYCIARDMTGARHQAEVLAERTRERDRLWQSSQDLLMVARFDTTIVAVNPAWTLVLGWEEVELVGRSFIDLVHPDDTAASVAEAERLSAEGRTTMRFENRYRAKDGSWVWLSWAVSSRDGLFHAVARDTTADKARQAALARAQEALRLYENIVQSDKAPVVAFDADYRVLAFNEAHSAAFLHVFGHQAKIGDYLPDRFPPDQKPILIDLMRRALAGESFIVTEEFGDPEIAKTHFEISYAPLKDEEGRIIGGFHQAKDVTARIRAQAELAQVQDALRQSQKMEAVGQLTGGIAHDFNNLLQGVAGSLDLIRRKPDDKERIHRWAEAGLQAAERGARLTGQLLAFSRAQKLELRPIALTKLVEGFSDMLDRTIGSAIRVHLDLQTDGVHVLGDEVQLEMAILNLALNARDAMPEGGDLTVRTKLRSLTGDSELIDGDYAEVAVCDTGSGIAPELIARVFDPFFTTKGVGKGTGLGLSQVYGMVRQAGGAVRIESKLGEGATICLLLRCTQAASSEESGPADTSPGGAPGALVLIVDDDPDVRRFLGDSLEALGYACVLAEDGYAGIAAFDRSAPDAIILDFAMPGITGAEVARQVKSRRPDLPIIFATGFSDSAAIEQAVGKSAHLLRKPFRVDELQTALFAALNRPEKAAPRKSAPNP